ncbi:MAG: hypothetical protein BroJett021_05800 [Chloroflexota bacterium]|jgi:hypothetical protein|nr:hypothetical protein [Caldilinea sp.]GIK71592.1 MAG: hypothetical protein BroJett021_05800 [Chloroflexota bacterium]
MANTQPGFGILAFKTVVAHTITYFLVGLVAFTVLNYTELYARPEVAAYMRQTNEPIVALGPALQPIRGILFALVFYFLREPLFGRKHGWLIIWLMLVALGIFSTFGPAPASVEGLIYLKTPIQEQLSGGLLEILAQSFLFSVLLYYWVNHPEQRWLTWVLGIAFVLVISMSITGFFMA